MAEFPTPEQIVASAATFLIEGGEDDAASVLLACTVDDVAIEDRSWHEDKAKWFTPVRIQMRGPRVIYDALSDDEHPIYRSVHRAIVALLPREHWLSSLNVRAEIMTIAPEWRAELVEMARGILIHNQAATAEKFRLWRNLRFRSAAEIRVAEALDRAGVMFFPLCMARLSGPAGRVNREPDFLVCKAGKWGVLEVDGEPYHPPSRTVQDHERDRLFKEQGIRLIEHFDASRCFDAPAQVVAEFLRLLDQAY